MGIGSIIMDYRDTMRRAQRLREIADLLERYEEDMIGSLEDEAGSAWRGDASGVFISKDRQLAGRARGHASQLRACAALLETAAIVYQKAEEASLRVFG